MSSLSRLAWVDVALLMVLVVSVLAGVWRGVVFELLALAGWIVAWLAAQWFTPDIAAHLPVGKPGSALNLGTSFVACFIAALLLWSLLARLVRLILHATPLSLPDRVLGAGFGLLRGVVLLLALATVVALTPAARSADWRDSRGAMWLNNGLRALKPMLPSQVARRLPG